MRLTRRTTAAILACVLLTACAPHQVAGTATRTTVQCETPAGALFNPCATLDTRGFHDRRDQCQEEARRMFDAQDYTGSALQRACFGAEDDPRVGLALDYGMTERVYRETEATELGY